MAEWLRSISAMPLFERFGIFERFLTVIHRLSPTHGA
jgi:hypothetical protein